MLSFKILLRFKVFTLFCALLCTMFFSTTALAQTLGIGGTASLTTNPSDPLPNSSVTVSLAAYTVNTTGATIRWYVDGGERVDDQNARSIAVQTGPIGTNTSVRASLSLSNGSTLSLDTMIRPSQTDLIIEADTYIPPFYKGRALPVGDELVRATAIPHVGGGGAPSAFTYTWKLDNKVLFGGPVRGQHQAVFTMPKSPARLEVSVFNTAGNRVSGAYMDIVPATPELHFYEDNPLRSMSQNSLKDSFTLIGDEVTVRAEPYFVAADIFSIDPVLEWTLDGREIQNFGDDPQAITLRGAGGGGTAKIGFELINQQSLLQFLRDSFTIYFE